MLTTHWCVSEQPLPTHSCDTTLHGFTYILGDPRDLMGWGRTLHHIHLRPQGHSSSTGRRSCTPGSEHGQQVTALSNKSCCRYQAREEGRRQLTPPGKPSSAL